ncbi:MAG TPA: BlaI/MecI/CopY family transcriptional regulator [Rubrivivax sp.]|nr:BlaI/MecI/CopY family transcriptional regulator [Rubrivivax sp.]
MSISTAEAHVMETLWQQAPLGAEDIAQALRATQDWKLPTVKTLIGRLLAKGAIVAEVQGRRYLYSPLLSRDDWLADQSQGLVDRWFGGQLAPLVSHFAAHRRLKPADLQALKQLLKDLDRG